MSLQQKPPKESAVTFSSRMTMAIFVLGVFSWMPVFLLSIGYLGLFGLDPLPIMALSQKYSTTEISDTDIIYVRNFTILLTQTCEDDKICKTLRINEYTHNQIQYVGDPITKSYIDTYTAENTMRFGEDCDGKARLTISMLRSIGIPAYPMFTNNHMVVLSNPDNRWIILDPTTSENISQAYIREYALVPYIPPPTENGS